MSDTTNECQCVNHCTGDIGFLLLVGHTSECPRATNRLTYAKAREVIEALVDGMDAWARDEDGVHPDAWAAYCRAVDTLGRKRAATEEG